MEDSMWGRFLCWRGRHDPVLVGSHPVAHVDRTRCRRCGFEGARLHIAPKWRCIPWALVARSVALLES